ncbi:hypothetical protein [Rhodococcus pyridinivorans]|jgi:hypothetical protein
MVADQALWRDPCEWHRRNIYRELDIDSRDGLRAALDSDGEHPAGTPA